MAIYSDEDALFIVFPAGCGALPDLHTFVEAMPAELEKLGKVAEAR